MDAKIYWDNQAKEHGSKLEATQPDPYVKRLEVKAISPWLKGRVLDIGCGNGHSTVQYAELPSVEFIVGVDYSEEMIKNCSVHSKAKFENGDIFDIKGEWDTILTNRCLINLPREKQKPAFEHIMSLLKPEGKYVMCECFETGLENMNRLRVVMGAEAFTPPWTCCYLNDVPKGWCFQEHFASTYYLITRGLIAHDHEKHTELKEKALKMPPVGNFAPISLYVYEKKL